MRLKTASTTTVALAIMALPAPGFSQPQATAAAASAPPVSISACEITRRARTRNVTNPYPLAITGGLHISFAVRGPLAATDVRFRVDYRGESEIVPDAGTFSSGATISHSYDNFSDYAFLGPTPNVCRVVTVRFSDGSVWNGSSRRQATQ